ncbi:AMP-binding protein [Myxococcus sp. RHSTA-1-4]|uniref:AMP-binding protein n=1 Tax=Myxococcus sp. RHSTA-1-4 TaxID=2874601 RepID=UPI001CBBFDF1|nr:AMP-binding protein [Myxococcus sp. RHSTA-1-4]MBZ4415729.1 AMP-binding protein [Myxococcus sp. RHSTA-1-4]
MVERIGLEQLLTRGRPAAHPVAVRDGQSLDFAAFEARAAGWRAAFERQPGLRQALFLEDTFEFAAALLGAWHAGRCVYLSSDAQPATLERLRGEVDGFAGKVPAQYAPLSPGEGARGGWRPLESEARALVVYTSGSSGEPTAIPKQLAQMTREAATLAGLFDTRLGDARVIATVSHQHIYGLLFRVLWPLTAGRPFLARSLPYPEDIQAALKEGPAALIASPAHLKRLPESLDWAGVRGNLRAVFSSGGPLSTEALHDCRALLGQAPVEVYGSSETGGVAWRQRTQDDALAWRVMPGVEVRTEDEALAVRSPHVGLPEGGWFQTEDRVRLLPEGFELLGRKDRLLKLEEKRVSLSAMERTLLEGGLLREARVLPLADGPRLTLAVVAVPEDAGQALLAGGGKRALNQALREQLSRRFEPGVLPRRFRYLEAMPVNSQGKTTEAALATLFDSRRPPLRVLERTTERALLALEAPASSPYFKGHFPGRPILPGVTQLEWVIRLGRELFPLPPDFLRMEAVKFQQLILPDTHLTLELTWTEAKASLQFKLTSEAGAHASGRIVFGGVHG